MMFEHVVVINLPRRTDRMFIHMHSSQWKCAVTRIDAFENRTDPEEGCFRSHVAAWLCASHEWRSSGGTKDAWVLVVEDDALFHVKDVPHADLAIVQVAKIMEQKNIDMMQLHVPDGCRQGVESLGYRCPTFSALAILGRASSFDLLARHALHDHNRMKRLPLSLDAWLLWCFCRHRPYIEWASSPVNIFVPSVASDISRLRRTWWRKGGSFYEDYCAALIDEDRDPFFALALFQRFMIAFSTRSRVCH